MATDLNYSNNSMTAFIANLFLLISLNTLTGWASLIASICLFLYNYKNIRKQIIEEGGLKKWLKNFINFKK
jgi:hypothetical protein